MKRTIIMLAFVAGTVSFSKAQQGQGGGGQGGFNIGTPAERAQRTIDGQSLASLNLTADQKTKTLALLTKMNTSTDSLMATIPAGGDRQTAFQAIAPKRTAITTAYENVFVSWLTPDQKKAYDTALAALKERVPTATGILGRGGFGGRGPQGGGGQGGGGQRPAGTTPPPGN